MDKTIRPRVSLILPVFNKEKYISHAIESCINQSYKNIEIILVDDKGSDRSIEIAQEYAQRDSRIKIVYNHSNLKTYHSRINGVKHASGEYIMFVDADDYLDLQACEACIEMFEKNKNLSFVMFNFNAQKEFNAQYCDDWHTIPQELDKKVLGLQEFLGFCTNREEGGWLNIVAKMIKKDLFLHGMQLLYNDTPLMMGEDILETMELLFVSEYIGLLAKPMYFYRFNEVSSMNTRNQTTLLNMIKDLSIIQSKIKSLARLWNTNDYGGGVINKSYVRYTEFARHVVLIISTHKLHRRLEYELLKYKPLPRNIRRCFTLKFLIKRKYYSVLIRLSKANIIKTNT